MGPGKKVAQERGWEEKGRCSLYLRKKWDKMKIKGSFEKVKAPMGPQQGP
jgi:hypothetical protein